MGDSDNVLSFSDPLLFLSRQEKDLRELIGQLVEIHGDVLSNRKRGKVNNIRSSLLALLPQLCENQEASVELYVKTVNEKKSQLEQLSHWEAEKADLIQQVNHVKSLQTDEGFKFNSLIDQFNDTSSQICEMENALIQMKQKAKTIQRELDVSKSIIDSRCSSLLDRIEVIEKRENVVSNHREWFKVSSEPSGFSLFAFEKRSNLVQIENLPVTGESSVNLEKLQLEVATLSDLASGKKAEFEILQNSIVMVKDVFIQSKSLETFLRGKPDEEKVLEELSSFVEKVSVRLDQISNSGFALAEKIISQECHAVKQALLLMTTTKEEDIPVAVSQGIKAAPHAAVTRADIKTPQGSIFKNKYALTNEAMKLGKGFKKD